MQFETIAVFILALGVLVFLFARRRVITGLQEENAALGSRLHKLGEVAERQRREIDALMATAQAERRARQMTILAPVANKPAPRPPITKPPEWKDPDLARDPFKNDRQQLLRQKEAAVRANTWEPPYSSFVPYPPITAPSSPVTMAEGTYQGAGGTFDGGGASGDYGSSSSSSCDSSSSTSSDSGSSSSSDSSFSSSSGD